MIAATEGFAILYLIHTFDLEGSANVRMLHRCHRFDRHLQNIRSLNESECAIYPHVEP